MNENKKKAKISKIIEFLSFIGLAALIVVIKREK